MYQKYSTEALVLKSRESGESDRTYALYTKDFGLVRARATAVRTEASRMRYALQNYARANVSLVRGKHGWRIVGATALQETLGNTENVSIFGRIARLTMRLVVDEGENLYLFAALAEAHRTLAREEYPSLATVEIICVARLLYALGYLSLDALETTLFTHTAYTGEHLREVETMQDELLSRINRAIAETHL